MLRHDFDHILKNFSEALQVKVNRAQAEFYWNAYKHYEKEDFAMACQQLGMGTPGKLPNPNFFGDNIAAAKEMRLAREKGMEKRQVQYMLQHGPKTSDDPMESMWAKCCCALVLHEPKKAASFVRGCLSLEKFAQWCESWRTESGEVASMWLACQLERVESSQNRPWLQKVGEA